MRSMANLLLSLDLMIIGNSYMIGLRISPLKTNAILLVNTNAEFLFSRA